MGKNFQLLGWDNPYGEDSYPINVIPVGLIDGRLVVVYPGDKENPEAIDPGSVYRHFTPEQLCCLRDFDHERDLLLAMNSSEIEFYPASRDKTVFRKLLATRPPYWEDHPAIRKMLQRYVDGKT